MTVSSLEVGQPAASVTEILDRLFRPTGIDGVYIRTGAYEDVVEALGRYITTLRPAGAEVFRFPPVVSRALIEKAGYIESFPQLLGCVCALTGADAQIEATVDRFVAGGTWTDDLRPTDLLLAPAACYPIYPIVAELGTLPVGGLVYDVAGDCFRREPSLQIDRLQSFRMREFVMAGTAEEIRAFHEDWIRRAAEIAAALGLCHSVEAASDPFFGRAGAMIGRFQISQALKFEMLVPVRAANSPTACMSFNYHRDRFGLTWRIETESGEPAHTACIAFGIDRLTIAMFAAHGLDVHEWPDSVRNSLRL